MAPKAAKSRKSNHKKKAWKHIDLSEINEYLDDKNLDERTGQTGKEVFFINKEGDQSNFKKTKLNNDTADEIPKIATSSRRETRSSKIDDSKAYPHLQSTSAVPAFKPDERVKQKLTPLESSRQRKRLNIAAKAIDISKADKSAQRKIKKQALKNSKYDLWNEAEKTPIGDVYVDYEEDFEKVRLARINKCPRNKVVSKKPSLLPAVETPHPGLSYNPDKDEHTDLLISIGEQKHKEMKAKKRLNKKIKAGYDPTVNVSKENAKFMAAGLISEDEDEEEVSSSNEDDTGLETQNKPVIQSDLKKRKSKKAIRNKIRERIDARNSKRRKDKKRLETQFTKLKHFVKEAKQAEELTKQRMNLKEQQKIEKLYKPARLSRAKYKDPEPEFCLEHELNGSIRKINTDGNLLMDRFKSLQRRNMIEHRRVLLKKRSKTTRKNVIRSSIFNQDYFEKEYLEKEDK